MTRARRAERPSVEERRPLYARMLCLRHLTPSGFLCFVFLEGAIALGLLLALAELVSWWGVLVLPALVALMVKLNDVIAGSLARAAHPPATNSTSLHPADTRPPPLDAAETRPIPLGRTGPGSASLGSASLGSASLGSASLGPASLGPASLPAASLRSTDTGPGGVPGGGVRPAAAAGIPMTENPASRLSGRTEHGRGGPPKRPWGDRVEVQEQWLRQSATRRYE